MAEYTQALSKAWSELGKLSRERKYALRFLADEYDIDSEHKRILSLSCNVPAKDYIGILLLHYLIKSLSGLPPLKEEWISFQQLPGGQGYFPAFKKRVIEVIARKYGQRPEGLLELTARLGAKKTELADVSVVVQAFERVPLLITLWRGDEEFGPEANMLFDRSINGIFCTEDIVVLAEVLAHGI